MQRVKSVKPQADYTLELVFSDGTRGRVSIADRLFGPRVPPGLRGHLFRPGERLLNGGSFAGVDADARDNGSHARVPPMPACLEIRPA